MLSLLDIILLMLEETYRTHLLTWDLRNQNNSLVLDCLSVGFDWLH